MLTLKFMDLVLSLLGSTLLLISALIVVSNLQDTFSQATFKTVLLLGSVGYAMYIGHIIMSFVMFLVEEHRKKQEKGG